MQIPCLCLQGAENASLSCYTQLAIRILERPLCWGRPLIIPLLTSIPGTGAQSHAWAKIKLKPSCPVLSSALKGLISELVCSCEQWVESRADLGGGPTPISGGEEEIKSSYSVSGLNSESRPMRRFSVPSTTGLGFWDRFQVKKRVPASSLLLLQWSSQEVMSKVSVTRVPREAEVLFTLSFLCGSSGEGYTLPVRSLEGFSGLPCLSRILSLLEESLDSVWMGGALLLCHMWVAQLSLVVSGSIKSGLDLSKAGL